MRRGSIMWGAAALAAAVVSPVSAAELRLARTVELAQLPLVVAERQHLIEKAAAARGVDGLVVHWLDPGRAGGLAQLAAGKADLAVAEPGAFLAARERAAGTPAALAALAAVSRAPYVLVARDPGLRTIRDFRDGDRIAVPGKSSGPALMLEMAASREWGIGEFARLDRFVVVRSDPEAAFQLRSGQGEVTAHFSRSPYSDDELANPALHRVMDSFDIAGPHSAALVVAPAAWCAANPALAAAVVAALQQADRFIADQRGAAAELFAAAAKDQVAVVEDLSDMIGDPDVAYSAAPAGVLGLADFLAATGRLAGKPGGWAELACAAGRELAGN
jgi:NitT/TauT family transport system substrate-binding protein